jgi:Ca-activated chloride channel family protein
VRFAWPLVLLSLLAVPLLVGLYWLLMRRRRRTAVTYSSLALIRAAAPRRSAWRRHVPFALVLAALVCLATAAARPQARVDVPVAGAAVIVALDVSGSMCATDVPPNRLAAAQDAVRDFVAAQDESTSIGLVVFSGFAQLAVAPTTDHAEVQTAIDSLTTGRGTTIGSAILKSIDAIAQINSDVAPTDGGTGLEQEQEPGEPGEPGAGGPAPSPGGTPAPTREPGTYAPEIVVLLTDGANTTGVTPEAAAEVAASRGVRVYPIGFGTQNPTQMVCTADQLGGDQFSPFRRGGPRPGPDVRNFLVADEPTLQSVAATTGGQYFAASDAGQLQNVLEDLPRQVEVQQRDVELSAGLVAVAVLLILGAAWAAVRWSAFPA